MGYPALPISAVEVAMTAAGAGRGANSVSSSIGVIDAMGTMSPRAYGDSGYRKGPRLLLFSYRRVTNDDFQI